jgi:Sigma-70 region 2
VTGNRADAADLMQDAFLKLWEQWDRIDRIGDPKALPVPRGAQRVPEADARRTPGHVEAGADHLVV